ncbi:MAG TPA: SDR family NAD(P)-dependent oxidoreductase [Thermoanaerobaculia bacterium]|nr:SDR family NAD(P)-dependent oxidoreductase [Thermoanaerobaculia bacterium]
MGESVELKDKTALIVGATGGIGGALACALLAEGCVVGACGRVEEKLARLEGEAKAAAGTIELFPADLSTEEEVEALALEVEDRLGRIDVLILAAGAYSAGPISESQSRDLDHLYRINLRLPYLVSRTLLPLLNGEGAQIVFLNSSAGLGARAGVGLYAATKSGLKALADSLRDELNPRGIRVLSVYPGRTATTMQELVHELEGRPYQPELLMQPGDVAGAIVGLLRLPWTAEATDLQIRPMRKPS